MNARRNAPLTAHGRAELVRRVLIEGQSAKAVAWAFGVDARTVAKRAGRCLAEGPAGLADRFIQTVLCEWACPASDHRRRRPGRIATTGVGHTAA